MILVCADHPTRETERPTFIAGLTHELNKSVSKNICPSVIEITFVGIYADTSPACVSTIGNAVSDPVFHFTFPFVISSTYSALILAALSRSFECK